MLLECLIILDKYKLVCYSSPLGKLTCSWEETHHQTQNTFKAYAVTLTSGDIGKLISMMPPLKKNAQNYVRQQTAWSSAKTPTRLQNEQRKPLPLIFIFRLSFTWSLVALAQNSLENLSSWLQSEWNEAANIQDLRAIIFFQGTIITQDWVHMVLFCYSSALREVVCFVIGCL